MDALFKRTGSGDFPTHIKALIQGPPKSGKTSLLATAPGIVIADCEAEANGLQSIAHKNIPYVTVDHPDRLQQLLFVLRDEGMRKKAAEQMGLQTGIQTVAIDTLDALQKSLKKYRMQTERKTKFERDDWGWLLDEMRQIINAFNALPLNVIYTVHTTTKQDDDEKMITMPGLQGAIAEEIAGMVGYSLLMQRTREVRPDGTPYTKYSLKVEGDDKNPHLGNRAAGRLPEVIEPDFTALQKAVYDGLQIAQAAAPIAVQTPIEIQQSTPAAAAPAPVAQTSSQPAAPAAPPSGDDEPVNATALQHLTRLFQEVGVPLDENLVKQRTLGEARTVVKMWNAIKQDAAEGKGTPGKTPQQEMAEFLAGMEFTSPASADQAAPEPPKTIEPKVNGNIEEVQAYTQDGADLAKVQEAYNLEAQREKPRATLVNWLVNKGAKTAGTLQTPVQNETPQQVAPPVTSEAPAADNSQTEAQAVELVKEELGGEVTGVVNTGTDQPAPCEECNKPIDDPDIALLSKTRFSRWLCVSDYIAETRKPRTTAPA